MVVDAKESAARLRAANRKEIVCPTSGVSIEIRRVWPRDFLSCPEIDMPIGSTPEEISRKFAAPTHEKIRAFSAALLRLGVISPRIADNPGDAEISVADLGADVDFVVNEIAEFSGFGTTAEVVTTFRDAPQSADGDIRRGSEKVREVPA